MYIYVYIYICIYICVCGPLHQNLPLAVFGGIYSKEPFFVVVVHLVAVFLNGHSSKCYSFEG